MYWDNGPKERSEMHCQIFYSAEVWSVPPYGWIDCTPTSISINRKLICFTQSFLSMHEPVCWQMGLKEHMTLAFDLVDEIYTALFLQVSGQQLLLILPWSISYILSIIKVQCPMFNSAFRFYVSIRIGRNIRIFGSQLTYLSPEHYALGRMTTNA
jgi:hypothetical protein